MIQQFLNRNSASFNQILRTYDWLVVWNLNFMTFHLEPEFYDFPFSWEFHHPNWRTPSFFRGVGIPPTSMLFSIIYGMSSFPLTCSIAMFLFTQRVTLNGGFQVMGVPPNHVMNDHFNIETIWNPCFFFFQRATNGRTTPVELILRESPPCSRRRQGDVGTHVVFRIRLNVRKPGRNGSVAGAWPSCCSLFFFLF